MRHVYERHGRGGWDWPEIEEPRSSTGSRARSALIPGLFLIYLAQPVIEAFGGHRPGWQIVAVVLTVVLFVASYLVVVTREWCAKWLRVLELAWLSLFPIALAFLLGPDSLIYFVYVISPAFFILPRNAAIIFGATTSAALLAVAWQINGSGGWSAVLTLLILTIAMVALSKLRMTQQRMAVLAVAEERSRLARDLHDVLGHSITTITVKAGLARRVLENGVDPERALAEVRDVEALARQAMSEVRATVSGYRNASLPAELVGARAALHAAGITPALPQAVDNVAAGFQETFAYVLREGVTNVIRHSGATRCDVRLGRNWLEVRDNGRASSAQVTASRESGGGHGLAGLAERVATIGGELTAHPLPEGGFLLRVDVPSGGERRTPDTPSPQTTAGKNRFAVEPSAGVA
ncbi:MAG TPA: histidine kinase [Pseudonocardiaceae bacterium]